MPNLAEYHVPVNADVPEIDVIFVDTEDAHINPLGVKGVGEIGIVGAPAAIANAVYHATGVRVRELPMTPDKVLGAWPWISGRRCFRLHGGGAFHQSPGQIGGACGPSLLLRNEQSGDRRCPRRRCE